jgi:hypothetical protein
MKDTTNIVGYYVELQKTGKIRGSYTVSDDKKFMKVDYARLVQHSIKLSETTPRVYKNIPVEMYLTTYNNLIWKEVMKMHRKWTMIPTEDLYQMYAEALQKCFNAELYIQNSRCVLRAFYNTANSHIRKNFNHLTKCDSLDDTMKSEDSEMTFLDALMDEDTDPVKIEHDEAEEQRKVDQFNNIVRTIKSFGYGQPTIENILFELDRMAQSRETRRILERTRAYLRSVGDL